MPTSSNAAGYHSALVRPRTPRTEMVVTVAHKKPAGGGDETHDATPANGVQGTQQPQEQRRPGVPPVRLQSNGGAAASDAPPTCGGRASAPSASAAVRSGSSTPRLSAAATPGGPKNDINLENFEDRGVIKNVVNSPRSLQVCGRFGIHPSELVHRPLQRFTAPGVPAAIARMRYEHYESNRVQKLEMLRAERRSMPEVTAAAASADDEAAPVARPYAPRQLAPPSRRPASPSAVRPPSPAAVQRRVGSSTPASQPVRRASTPQPSPAARIALEERQRRAPSPAAVQRAKAMEEAEARRNAARSRASAMELNRESEAAQKLREREARSQQHVRALLDRKVTALEHQKLKRDDALDRVRQLGRIKQYNADLRVAQWESKVESRKTDPFALLAAREEYRTPRQRQERARSASVQRITAQ